MYYVYVIKSSRISRYYIDATKNLARRLAEHNDGKCRSTKAYIPWELTYKEDFISKSEAFRREKEIKSYKSGIKFKELQNSERWQSG